MRLCAFKRENKIPKKAIEEKIEKEALETSEKLTRFSTNSKT